MSEITPKVLAFRFNQAWVKAAIVPLTIFYYLVWLPRVFVQGIVGLLGRLFGVSSTVKSDDLDEEELLTLINQGTEAGTVDTRELEMIENVLEFDELTVGRLMTPRPDIFCVPLHAGWDGLTRTKVRGFLEFPCMQRRRHCRCHVVEGHVETQKNPPSGPRQLRSLLIPPVLSLIPNPPPTCFRSSTQKKSHRICRR